MGVHLGKRTKRIEGFPNYRNLKAPKYSHVPWPN